MKTCSKCKIDKPEDEFYIIKGKLLQLVKYVFLHIKKLLGQHTNIEVQDSLTVDI
jgi:hypothetical protein